MAICTNSKICLRSNTRCHISSCSPKPEHSVSRAVCAKSKAPYIISKPVLVLYPCIKILACTVVPLCACYRFNLFSSAQVHCKQSAFCSFVNRLRRTEHYSLQLVKLEGKSFDLCSLKYGRMFFCYQVLK